MCAAQAPCTHTGVHRLCRELSEGGQLSPRSWGLLPGVWKGQEGGHTWRVRNARQDDLTVNQVRKGKAQRTAWRGRGHELCRGDNRTWRLQAPQIKNDTDSSKHVNISNRSSQNRGEGMCLAKSRVRSASGSSGGL